MNRIVQFHSPAPDNDMQVWPEETWSWHALALCVFPGAYATRQ